MRRRRSRRGSSSGSASRFPSWPAFARACRRSSQRPSASTDTCRIGRSGDQRCTLTRRSRSTLTSEDDMRISELAEQAGVTVKAVRYYERLGLVSPARLGNGYREYGDDHVRVVSEIRELAATGIPPGKAKPFIECLGSGPPP